MSTTREITIVDQHSNSAEVYDDGTTVTVKVNDEEFFELDEVDRRELAEFLAVRR